MVTVRYMCAGCWICWITLQCVSSRLIGFLSLQQPSSFHSNAIIFGKKSGHYVLTSIQSTPLRPAVEGQDKYTLSTEVKHS